MAHNLLCELPFLKKRHHEELICQGSSVSGSCQGPSVSGEVGDPNQDDE
jgi:hypothetical protein